MRQRTCMTNCQPKEVILLPDTSQVTNTLPPGKATGDVHGSTARRGSPFLSGRKRPMPKSAWVKKATAKNLKSNSQGLDFCCQGLDE